MAQGDRGATLPRHDELWVGDLRERLPTSSIGIEVSEHARRVTGSPSCHGALSEGEVDSCQRDVGPRPWSVICEREFGHGPGQLFDQRNRVAHLDEFEGDPRRRR
jgi:hypothetical protein